MSIPYVRTERFDRNLDAVSQQDHPINHRDIQKHKLASDSLSQVSSVSNPSIFSSSSSASKSTEISNHTSLAFTSLEQGSSTDKLLPKKKQPFIPTPLSLPKRFQINNTQQQPSQTTTELSRKDFQEPIPSLQQQNLDTNPEMHTLQPLGNAYAQYLSQYQPVQQTFFYNQTGSLVTLPVSAPPYPVASQPWQHQYQRQRAQQQQQQQQQQLQQLQTQQPLVMVQPILQQIVYARTSNGQLVPLLVQQPPYYNTIGTTVPQKVPKDNANVTNTNVGDSVIPEDPAPNKRRKTAMNDPPTEEELIQHAEQLQKQHILRQMRMHPYLHRELQTPNISDIFQTPCDSATSATSASSNEVEDVIDDELEIKAKIDQQHSIQPQGTVQPQSITRTNESALSDNIDNTPSPFTVSVQDQKPQKVIGTVTLGAFTYEYSQTLSGDSTRDRELFDRLTDNAWKSCLSKR